MERCGGSVIPRKEWTRALGSKPNTLGTKRKNSPGRYAETTEKIGQLAGRNDGGDGKRCAYDNRVEAVDGGEKIHRCKAPAGHFVRWAWWCDAHVPEPDPDCVHEQWSPLWGRKVCTVCTVDLGELPERVAR